MVTKLTSAIFNMMKEGRLVYCNLIPCIGKLHCVFISVFHFGGCLYFL